MKTFQILSLFLIIGNNLLSQPGDYVDENYILEQREKSWSIFEEIIAKSIVHPIKLDVEVENYSYFSNGLCPVKVNSKLEYFFLR
jgi:hypothetical protein